MDGISVSVAMLLIKGIAESLISVFAIHVFTRTKIDVKKYLILSLVFVVATYLIRLLPISLGVNTILSFMVMIISFQFAYKSSLTSVIRSIASVIAIFILSAISEVINMLLLTVVYGKERAEDLFNSSVDLTQSFYTIPSTVFLGLFVIAGYFLIKHVDQRKKQNGETGKKTGE